MPSSLNGIGVTFNDGTQLQSANEAGGNYIQRNITAPGTWVKPAGLKAVKVTVVGAGGNGGTGNGAGTAGGGGGGGGYAMKYISAPSIPGPVAVTRGTAPSKTSSFGAFVSATGGGNGANAAPTTNGLQGAGGAGSGGDVNLSGLGSSTTRNSTGEGSAFAYGFATFPSGSQPLRNGNGRGGGGAGGGFGPNQPASGPTTGGTGATGLLLVEEFY